VLTEYDVINIISQATAKKRNKLIQKPTEKKIVLEPKHGTTKTKSNIVLQNVLTRKLLRNGRRQTQNIKRKDTGLILIIIELKPRLEFMASHLT